MKTTFLVAAAVLLLGSAAMAQQKVDVCHIPPENPSNADIISVGESAVPAHLAHGDRLVSDEVCDGVDNDCDGTVDDDPTDVGHGCTVGQGECEATGTVVCVDGARECDAEEGEPSDETCDGLDNDCDGAADEGDVCVSLIGDLVRIGAYRTHNPSPSYDDVIVVQGVAEIDCPNPAFEMCGFPFEGLFDVEAASLTFDARTTLFQSYPDNLGDDFNGHIYSSLDLVGGTGDITGFTLSTDIAGLDVSRVTFTADSVSVNLLGLVVTTGQSYTVNLLSGP